jgi:hypothetical protein
MRDLAVLRERPPETQAAVAEPGPSVRLTPLPRFARLVVRGDEKAVAAIGAARPRASSGKAWAPSGVAATTSPVTR